MANKHKQTIANIGTQSVIDEALRRGWTVDYLGKDPDQKRFYSVTDDKGNKAWFFLTMPQASSFFGNRITLNKLHTLEFIQSQGYRVPPYAIYSSERLAKSFLNKHVQVVVKPVAAGRSEGVTINIKDMASLKAAVAEASKYGGKAGVVIQKQLFGRLYRLLVIDGKLFAAAYRRAPFVVGDGKHTVSQLIAIRNLEPLRNGDDPHLKKISLAGARKHLGNKQLNQVLVDGQDLDVIAMPEISLGGQSVDVTDQVHSDYVQAVVSLTKQLGLTVCGFDLLTPDISQPMPEYLPILEANSIPGFKLHLYPTLGGEARNPAPELLDAAMNHVRRTGPGSANTNVSMLG